MKESKEQVEQLINEINLYQQLRFEQSGRDKVNLDNYSFDELTNLLNELKSNEVADVNEPNDLDAILDASKSPNIKLEFHNFENKIKGAIVGRFAGCLLGVPVEGYSIEYMEELAKKGGTPFPPIEYWHEVDRLDWVQYGVDLRKNYTLDGINAVFVDDDITYTVLNLLVLDKFGPKYSIDELAKLWLDVVPYACTAEDAALKEMRAGKPGKIVANNNPFIEWIGAAIRADAFGYVYAGDPLKAVKCCYNDAYLTHRRNGIYGEMFLAATIASAFAVKPLEAIKIGMDFIPIESKLYKDLAWALSYEGTDIDFKTARKLIDERFIGMDSVHVRNNMCVIAFVCMIAGTDFDKAVSTAVAFGLDNDCNGASIGSIYGAYLGIDKINPKWYKNFNNSVHTYLKGFENITLDFLFDLTIKLKDKYNN